MFAFALLFLLTLFVAYANGANDNFKGVATLYGANVAGYRTAIVVATLAAFAGCIASLFMADGLMQAFSGKGLVPSATAASPIFLLAVATGAGSTVLLAAIFGFPISTTHGLTGALIGAGFLSAGDRLDLSMLGTSFFMPLLLSPAISILLTALLYKIVLGPTGRLRAMKESCVCIAPDAFVAGAQVVTIPADRGCVGAVPIDVGVTIPSVSIGYAPACGDRYSGVVFGATGQKLIDAAHYLSAIALSFARGLNDAPKIVGLMLVVKALDLRVSMVAVATAMALGGWINAHRVAETMSKKICEMNDGQALIANLVTAFLVIFASRLGMPVSTTHVSVGAITGIGLINGSASGNVVRGILMSWLLTLPIAGLISGAAYVAYDLIP